MKILTQKKLAEFEKVPIQNYKKSNFSYAFYLLSKEKRAAITNIYAVCSYLDEIVDCEKISCKTQNSYSNNSGNNNENSNKKFNNSNKKFNSNENLLKKERLNWWKEKIHKLYCGETPNELISLCKTIEKYQIPVEYFDILIDGIARDLTQKTYSNIDELLEYCYGVASIVGLICINIFIDNKNIINSNMKEYAINLGYALQLTNIIRDVNVDAKRGYFYLPQSDLAKFSYSYDDILQKNYNKNFINLMEFQFERAISFYSKSEKLIECENKENLRVAEAMKSIYLRLLHKIKAQNFNIYRNEIKLSLFEKISALL